MTLSISDNHVIKEHTFCKGKKDEAKQENINASSEQIQKIKKYISEQERFSRIKTSRYIMEAYNYKYPEAKKVLKLSCDSF